MNNTVTFYHNPMSRARVVHWMLEELGVPYETKILDMSKGEHKTPEFLKINPMGKLPTIVHKGVAVTETAAICMYLADAFPEKGLAPAFTDPSRGSYYRWFFFTVNCLEQAVADRLAPRSMDIPAGRKGYGSFEDTIRVLEGAVSKGYLLGDKFSAADLYLGSVLGWYFSQKMLEPTPVLGAYAQRCSDRPSFKRFMDQLGSMS